MWAAGKSHPRVLRPLPLPNALAARASLPRLRPGLSLCPGTVCLAHAFIVQFRVPSLCIPSDSVGTEPFGSITAQGRREVCPALLLEHTFNMPYTRAHSHLASLLLGFPHIL